MPNEAAIGFLTNKITALRVIQQELSRIYTRITNLDFADDVRQRLTSINETLFALESARNSLEATTNTIPPPTEERVQSLNSALRQLDAYVRNDQNIHMALNYLLQVASLVKSS
jgi:hypothetical protein